MVAAGRCAWAFAWRSRPATAARRASCCEPTMRRFSRPERPSTRRTAPPATAPASRAAALARARRSRTDAGAAARRQRAHLAPPDQLLFEITKHGVAKAAKLKDYDSAMPAFAGVLSDAEIVAVLSWIKSQWPPEIRRHQEEMNEAARRRAERLLPGRQPPDDDATIRADDERRDGWPGAQWDVLMTPCSHGKTSRRLRAPTDPDPAAGQRHVPHLNRRQAIALRAANVLLEPVRMNEMQ